jgi:hypothetical protein
MKFRTLNAIKIILVELIRYRQIWLSSALWVNQCQISVELFHCAEPKLRIFKCQKNILLDRRLESSLPRIAYSIMP